MALYFNNQYADTVWIAFVYLDPNCSPTHFRKIGWWQVNSGDNFNAWDTNLRTVNQYAAFYAEEYRDEGGATWGGNGNNWYLIPELGFDQCYDDNTNCTRQPNFALLDFNGAPNCTVTIGRAAGHFDVEAWISVDPG
ncbi:hypothetical protein [Paraburkholderia sp. 32]|uniref:hypothetical protein n=1 Tax=Paraburkholderia sp. 32 TaxID=2991057 RepID=UPI003D23433F